MGQFGIGQAVRRVEDVRFVTGAGRYTDDINLPRQAHAYVLRSPHAHARIRSIETGRAAAMPGVLGIFTAADLEGVGGVSCMLPLTGKDGRALFAPPRPALARERVRHVGDAVAFVVAETQGEARTAAEEIAVDYQDLPAVSDPVAAMAESAPRVWDEAKGNIALDWEKGDRAAVEAAFAKARHVVRLELVNNRVVGNPMEPRVAIGEWSAGDGRYVLHTTTQGGHNLQRLLADQVFKVPYHRVRVLTPDVGGAFGIKIFLYSEQILSLWAARRLGRPVKWLADRSESFLADIHSRDNLTRAELALDESARILGMRVSTIANMGAYVSQWQPFIATEGGTSMLAGLYRVPALHVEVKCAFTHTAAVDAYRGAGRPEACYVIERLIDSAARQLELDPAEIRRRNFVPSAALPYKNVLGQTFDSGRFAEIMDKGLESADWAGFPARREAARRRGKLSGIGFATYVEVCGRGSDERAEIRFDQSGGVTLMIGTQNNGQGHETAYAQILEDKLGVPFGTVRVIQGDTDVVPYGRGTGGSRSLNVGGSAIFKAADKVIAKARKIAAHMLEAAEPDIDFAQGVFTIAGTDRRVNIQDVAKASYVPQGLPAGLEPGLDEMAHYLPAAPTYPNGCHICEVEIDSDTGVVSVVRYNVVDDFGRLINPLLVAGQVHGGVAQGLGQALLEGCVYDESGQLLTGSFMDYCMPRADNLSEIGLSFDQESPCTTNPLGAKGCGEAGAIGAPPAAINAIVDALAGHGVRHIDMPVTPERIWRALNGHRGTQGRSSAA